MPGAEENNGENGEARPAEQRIIMGRMQREGWEPEGNNWENGGVRA